MAAALAEDLGAGDLCAPLLEGRPDCAATLTVREDAVLCGRPWFEECFRQLAPEGEIRIAWGFEDGDDLAAGDLVCEISGAPAPMLAGERTAINFLQTLSCTAAASRAFAEAAPGAALDTRKTLPGLRHAQKYAVRVGGARNHREGLFDAPLLKENHLAAGGGISKMLGAAKDAGMLEDLQIEVRSLAELALASQCGARRVLLDNFSPSEVATATAGFGDIELEVSGNVTLDNIADYARAGAGRISIGAMTKNVVAIDFSLVVREGGGRG